MSPNLKKTFSGVSLGCSLLFAQSSLATAGDDPMNVLMIAIDDLKAIGTLFQDEQEDFLALVYPDPELRREVAERMTPNLQRLADRGVNFQNAYCPSPACNPSRAAIMTGMRPHVTGLTSIAGDAFFRDWEFEGERPMKDAVTIPELLKNNGWYTAGTGKIFHSEHFHMQDGNRSWHHWAHVGGRIYHSQDVLREANRGGRPEGPIVLSELSPQNFETEARRVRWGQIGYDHETYHQMNDYRTADFIAQLIEEGENTTAGVTYKIPEDTPFFISLGIFRPHLPFLTTKDLIDLFPVEEIAVTRELLEFFIRDGADMSLGGLGYSGIRIGEDGEPEMGRSNFNGVLRNALTVDPEDGDLKAWREMLAHYFAAATVADRSVGRVLDALDASPYSDNTMVILWSDHGFHLGEKLHVGKFTLWNDAARAPFMIMDPRFPESAGMTCHTPVSMMDIYPTVASMAGLELPDHRITGTDLTPLLRDPTLGRIEPVLVTYGRGNAFDHTVRLGRYKLAYYTRTVPEPQIELYDLAKDPQEYRNLAVLPEYAEIKAMMKEVLFEALESGYGNP